jgi:hypothetical protein
MPMSRTQFMHLMLCRTTAPPLLHSVLMQKVAKELLGLAQVWGSGPWTGAVYHPGCF